ncbi:acetyl-CoA carboxylase carboxyltransferase subunit alpha [soil metagenome]
MSAQPDTNDAAARLEQQITQLKQLGEQHGLDVADKIDVLEQKLAAQREETYRNLSAVERVQLARHPKRPYTLDYIDRVFSDFIELHCDRNYRDDEAVVCGWARLEGRTVMVIGHQKGRDMKENLRRNFGMPHPEGYRKALRLMEQAAKFGRPVVTLIDTPGAYPGIGAEERGQAEAIARNLREMARLPVPVVAVVIGEGGSGGALALGVADRVLMMENAIYSVISPEGCAAILWKTSTAKDKAAHALKLTARDLVELRVVDALIPEPMGGAHHDWDAAAGALRSTLARELDALGAYTADALVRRRWDKFEQMGAWRVVGPDHGTQLV